jgi:hypothetical protein
MSRRRHPLAQGHGDPPHGPSRVRRLIGTVLHVAAQTSDGQWLVVAWIEEADDEYLVVSARELTEDEVAAVKAMIQGDVP